MNVRFNQDDKEFKKIFSQLRLMEKSNVQIGFQDGSVTRSQVKNKRRKTPGQSMATIAAQNEFGMGKIPARSFMRTSFDENIDKIRRVVDAQYSMIIEGQSTVRRSLEIMGLYVQDLIQEKIRAIHYPPNAPITISLKGSSKPLIDFGQMIQSVRYKVNIE